MKTNAVYILHYNLLADAPSVELVDKLSENDLDFFYSTINLNLLENILLKKDNFDVFILASEINKQDILSEFNEEIKIISHSENNLKNILSNLAANEFSSHKNNLIILSDVIDLKASDIDKHFNLLNIDDKAITISKSQYNKIKTFGFNNFSETLIKYFLESQLDLDKFLSFRNSCDYFINLLPDFLEVKDVKDLRLLYDRLSTKSSYEYCSPKMHERFTHIFIEYKDLLK